ncbi:hypothetical protein NQ317_009907 [Molorchus minor]|uniref:Amine oxidase domain-containing protein n=1 Tax=Molorchus minor TaxID=1323400 RepID=A0ABQ9IPS2_9CUCU|nr:hypothetical protein NQ317_009907 [Molorchus minor]
MAGNYSLAYDGSAFLSDLSTEPDYVQCEGDLSTHWNGRGYKTILEVMLQNSQTPAKPYRLTIHDHETLFEPGLPEEKTKVIKTVGFGAILKIILHFPEPWWSPDDIVVCLWSEEDKNKIKSEYGKGPEKVRWHVLVDRNVRYTSIPNNPNVVILFFSGSMVPEIEKTDDQVLIEGIMYMFRKFLGDKYNVVNPDKMLNIFFGGHEKIFIRPLCFKNEWNMTKDFIYDTILPLFLLHRHLGTAINTSVAHIPTILLKELARKTKFADKLATPLTRDGRPVVQFAGEATHPHYFSTVHGAIESGYREGDRLIKLYKTG